MGKIQCIGILTSGGDAPGMNAAIRAVTRAGISNGFNIMGVYRGYEGLIKGEVKPFTTEDVSGIITRGGTILKTARCKEFTTPEGRQKAFETCQRVGIDALVVIGGNGSLTGARDFGMEFDFPVIGLPGTIDNDVGSTDETIGFATALNTICDCVDKLKDTSGSHQRCSLIEVMGRHCGDLAMFAALAEGAEGVICVEHPLKKEVLFRKLRKMKAQNKSHAIIIVSENLLDINELAGEIAKETGFDTRTEVLGRLQRGGSPTAHDRILAARLGARAVSLLVDNKEPTSRIVGVKQNEIVDYPIDEAVEMKHRHTHGLRDLIDMLQ